MCHTLQISCQFLDDYDKSLASKKHIYSTLSLSPSCVNTLTMINSHLRFPASTNSTRLCFPCKMTMQNMIFLLLGFLQEERVILITLKSFDAWTFEKKIIPVWPLIIGSSCEDKNRNCRGWKKFCEDQRYRRYMRDNCKRTCGVCS